MAGKPNNNHEKGAKAERDVARYIREQGVWMAERRLREGVVNDMGDIDGVPYTVIQVKYVEQPSVQAWMTATLRQRQHAGTPFCLLIVRKRYKRPEAWDAYMPAHQVGIDVSEVEAWGWVRMDLRLAVEVIKGLTGRILSPSDPSLSTMVPSFGVSAVPHSAPSTGSPAQASPTT